MMDTNDNKIDSLRSAWRNMKIETSPTDNIMIRHTTSGGRAALISRFSRMEIVAAVMSVGVPLMIVHRLDMSEWLGVASSLFFILMLLSMECIRRSLRRIDPTRMTVVEALESVYISERRIFRHRMWGWMMAVPLLAWMMVEFYHHNMAMFAGGCAGIAVGLPVGYLCWRRVRRTLSKMKEELEAELE